MTKASSLAELHALHKLVSRSFKERLEEDLKDKIPTDAATLGAIIKFLKDNSVTADPADQDDLTEMRQKLAEQSRQRRLKVGNVVQLAQSDLDVMQG